MRKHYYRVWLSKLAVTEFQSSHHHHVFGRPPAWHGFTIQHVRFFRVCYRIVRVAPNRVRWRLDQLHLVVPVEEDNPDAGLMLLTTQPNENLLPPPRVLAGLDPDPIQFDDEGVFLEALPAAGVGDILAGAARVGDVDPPPNVGMGDFRIDSFFDVFTELTVDGAIAPCRDGLPLYCIMLNDDGTLGGEMVPIGPGGTPVQLTNGAVPAIPIFVDEDTGEMMGKATKLGLELAADPFGLRLDRGDDGMLSIEVPPGYLLRQSGDLSTPGASVLVPAEDGVLEIDPAALRVPRRYYRGAFDSFFDVTYP